MRIALLCVLFLFSAGRVSSQEKYQLSSHILDITAGKPAAGVKITLSKMEGADRWVKIDERNTDDNGRVKDFLRQDGKANTGIYKLTFHTAPYFQRAGVKSFYPFIEVVFELKDNEHYHVPITLTPFGYSTYRGS